MSESNNDFKNVSKHILPTSSNLLGLCFILISFIKLWKMDKKIDFILDIFVGIAITLFLSSSIFSYMSMRARKKALFYEKIADLIFLIGLFFITLVSLMIVFEVL
ncbi:hypothetical protein [Thermodesulfovibrio yellowstonii]|uniref:Uncharacterized protein n=1 Tax=Thermodesulfovibrio yellowstonii TaxID=28262 RepID=A0A9W6GEJ3_9BACT|nr:hypothetical protein [Thermodesulfovibrio islandicus]GLI53859.1 hypothetical protein TISLANDTSLP1_15520 [Thermodesulfovibrio islandicus]